ncbi:MAG: hypothetical protein HKN83_08295 [Gammaproteobacteria bacterium]|nr:hypothetical protein [Gammaproteobacteria bacterium]
MRINRYIKSRDLTRILFSSILVLLPMSAIADIHENIISQNKMTSHIDVLVKDVLKNTEQSLSLVETNSWDSLQHVENALASIREIKSQLSPNTHVEAKSSLVLNDSKEYWFKYPRVDDQLLNSKDDFPTLHSKFQSGILYRSEGNKNSQDEIAAYFDYAFAYASLITAREALTAKNYREATSSLKWVFEAVYLNPDFNVVEHNNEIMIDKLLNMNGDFPYISSNAWQ